MTSKTRTRSASKTRSTKPAKPVKAAAAKPTNRLTDEQHAARGKTINSRLAKGDTLSQIALDLGIRPNMAHGYVREAEFAANPALALKAKNTPDLLKKVDAERQNVKSQHNSWGWLSTRTGIPEGTLKKQMTDAGYSVSGSNIASERKAARPAKPAGTRSTKTTTSSSAKGKAARSKGARRSRSAANPS